MVYVAVSNDYYDAQGNEGTATNVSFTIDTTAPTLDSATVIGTTLTATFSENLDTSKKAAGSAFTVDVAGSNSDPTVSAYTLSGKTATMTLSKAVKQGETVKLSYTQPSGAATKIADLAGNALASIPSGSEVGVTNNTDNTAPTVASATVIGNTLTATFSENLDTSKKAAESAFTVDVAGTNADPTVSAYTLSGKTATMTLSKAVKQGETLTLSYTQPSGNATKIADLAGNALASIPSGSEVSVTNNTDNTAPTVAFAPANGARSNAKSADIVLTFSEPVYANNTTTAFTADTVDDVITLTEDDADGDAIGFAVTVTTSGANANKVVTINPSSDLEEGVVYVAVSNAFYDAQGNQGAATNASFTIDTTLPTISSASVNGTALTVTFSENLDTSKKAAESAFTVDVSGSNDDPTVSSYTLAGKTATMTLSKAVKQGETVTLRYTQPSGKATKIVDVAGNALATIPSGSEVSVTNNTDTTAPTVTFKLGNTALTGTVFSNDSDGNISLIFSEPVYADASTTALTSDNVDDIITLKKTGADGDAIAFDATVATNTLNTNAIRLITVNPTNNLEDGVVYLAISNAFYDARGNQGAATNATFTVDTTAPTLASATVIGTTLTATFSEDLDTSKKAVESAFTVNVSGTNDDPTVSSYSLSGKTATMTLSKAVKQGETVTLRYTQPAGAAAKIADLAGNVMASIPSGSAVSVTNNTDDTAPTVAFAPANGARSNAKSADIVLTFSEPVYADTSATAFTSDTVDDIIVLNKTGVGGTAIPFTVSVTTTGANTNKVVTINPKNDLEDGVVYVAVSNIFYDAQGNQGTATSASFTIDTTPPTLASATVIGATLTATFSENLDTSKKAAESAFTVDVSGTNSDPTVSSYTLSGKTATMTLSKAVKQGESLTLTYTQPSGAAAKIADLAGNVMASIPSGSEVSVTNNTDNTAPTVTFSPANGARSNAKSADIVLTFSEPVYADTSATAFTSDIVDYIITLKKTGANGDDINFDATVTTSGANANKVVTVNPSSDLDDGAVYVAVSNIFYDAQGNRGAATNATFTIDTAPPTISTASVNGTALTVTFSENLDTSKKAAESAFTVNVSGTNDDPTVSSYSLSGKTATMTLSKAVKQGETVKLTYTQPAGNAAKIADLAGNAMASIPSGSAVSVTDNTAPTAAFALKFKSGTIDLTGALMIPLATGDIVLTFDEPVYANNTATAFTSDTIDDVITLNKTGVSGDAIAFAVTVTTTGANANKVVTIDPTNDLDDGVVYVAVSNDYYDAQGNRGAATNASFTVDTIAPTLLSAVVVGDTLTATFSENLDTSEKAAESAFTVDVAGTSNDPTVSSYTLSGKTATMTLSAVIRRGQSLTLSYTQPSGNAAKIFDVAGNALASIPSGSEVSVTNNDDNTAPTVAFAPADGARTTARGTDIVLTFSEPVYASNTATAFTADTVDDIITLNKTGVSGTAIPFAVSVTTSGANANKIVTINPSSDLEEGVVYVAVSNAFYDAQGNQGAATNVSFTIDTTPPMISSASVNGTALTVTFSENLDTSKKAAESAFIVDVSGTSDDPTVSSYTLAGKTATMTLSKAVKEGETVTLRYTQPTGAAAKIADLVNIALQTIPQISAVSVTNNTDNTAPTLASATVVGATLTATFSENLDTAKKAAESAFTVDVSGSNDDPTVSSYTLSGKTATMTLSKAVKQGETVTLTYTQPAGAAAKIADVAGNVMASIPSGSAVSVTNNTDNTAPTAAFALKFGSATIDLTGALMIPLATGDIVLTFSEPVYANNTATAFTADTVDDIITLKKTGADGDAIAFAVSVTTTGANANKVVTIDPTNDLDDGVVYVAVSNDYYDAQGNRGSATNASFTVDTVAPTLLSAVVVGDTLTATFSENLDTSEKAAESAFTVDVSGTNDDPTVSSYTLSGKTATLILSDVIKRGQSLTLSYTQPAGNATKLIDVAGNALASIPSGSEVSVTNNDDNTAPTVAFAPANGARSNDRGTDIVLTFSEPVYASNTATAFTDSTVDDVITLNKTGVGGDRHRLRRHA